MANLTDVLKFRSNLTGADIKSLYEAEPNAFTDADKTKLAGVESGATADQTANEILTAIKTVDGTGSGLDADTVDGIEGASIITTTGGQTISGSLTATTFTSTQATGTAPLTVSSTTVVPNLNADLLDGYNIGTGGTSYIPYVDSSGHFTIGGTAYTKAVFALDQTTSAIATITKTSDFADQFVIASKNASDNGHSLPLIFNLGGGAVSNGISAGIVAFRESSPINSWNTGLSFWTNGITGGNTDAILEKMRIDSGGNVGIGTTTPSEKLDVVGNVEATRFISTQTTGTAPLTVSSTTVVPNLNADLLDGLESTVFTKVYQPIVTVTYNDGGNSTLDHSDGNCVFTLTSNGTSTTIIHSNVPNNVRYGLELHLTWTAGAITFPASWSKGDALPSATGNYVITAVTIDGGTSFKIAVLTE